VHSMVRVRFVDGNKEENVDLTKVLLFPPRR
jgi:hypothetical protein